MEKDIDSSINEAEKNQEKQTTDEWIRNSNGKIKPNSPTHVVHFLSNNFLLKNAIKLNAFTEELETTTIKEGPIDIEEGAFKEDYYTDIRMYAEKELGVTFTQDALYQGVEKVARNNQYNPIVNYMDMAYKSWDQKKRLKTIFCDFLGAEESETTFLITRLFFTGAVATVYNSKANFDYCLDLVGSQGVGKTLFFRRMAPLGYYTDAFSSFSAKDDIARMARNFIVNDDEMTATKNTSFEELKKFISLIQIQYRPPYARKDISKDKKFILVRTTNIIYYLKDKTGDRRYLPIRCYPNPKMQVAEKLTPELVLQYWGEAIHWYKENPQGMRPFDENENQLLVNQREKFRFTDDVDEEIYELMHNEFKDQEFIASRDINEIINPHGYRRIFNRIKEIMTNDYNYKANVAKRINGKAVKGYLKNKET